MSQLPAEASGCGAMAAGWVRGKDIGSEFKDIREAREGDILFLADWAGRRISFAIFIVDDRVATRSEIRGNRVVMSRLPALAALGYEFAGGVHVGR